MYPSRQEGQWAKTTLVVPLPGGALEYTFAFFDQRGLCIISVNIHTKARTIAARDSRFAMLAPESIVPTVLVTCVVALLLAVSLFDHDFSEQEYHCNLHVCIDFVAIAQVAMGVLSVGNPISIGVVSVSSFVAIGLIPM
jgi:protein-S-isoprenylcysteine O-methyltransferase Ste14